MAITKQSSPKSLKQVATRKQNELRDLILALRATTMFDMTRPYVVTPIRDGADRRASWNLYETMRGTMEGPQKVYDTVDEIIDWLYVQDEAAGTNHYESYIAEHGTIAQLEEWYQMNLWLENASSLVRISVETYDLFSRRASGTSTPSRASPVADGFAGAAAERVAQAVIERPRLPEIALPTFSGEPCEYEQFIGSFNRLIHENTALNNLDKFTYLRSCLTDRAKAIIGSLTFTADNYDIARTMITERYGNNELIVRALFKKLKDIPEAKMMSQVGNVYDHIKAVVSDLQNKQIAIDPLTRETLTNKFPNTIRQKLYKAEMSNRNWDTAAYMESLRQSVLQAEHLELVNTSSTDHTGSIYSTHIERDTRSGRDKFSQRRSSLIDRSKHRGRSQSSEHQWRKRPQSRNLLCIYCKKDNHRSFDCRDVETNEARRKVLKDESRCYICLRQGKHECRRKGCFTCSRLHNTSICPQREQKVMEKTKGDSTQKRRDETPERTTKFQHNTFRKRTSSYQSNALDSDSEQDVRYLYDEYNTEDEEEENRDSEVYDVSDPEPEEDLDTLSANIVAQIDLSDSQYVIEKGNVQQGTVIAKVGFKEKRVHTILDTASQNTFISKALRKEMGMTVLGTETIQIATFGNEKPKSVTLEKVYLDMRDICNGSTIRILVYAADHLVHPYRVINADAEDMDYLHKYRVHVTPTRGERANAHVLLGTDVIWNLLQSNTRIHKLPSGLIAFPTKVGTFIGGKCKKLNHRSKSTIRVCTVEMKEPTTTLEEAIKSYWDLDTMGIREQTTECTEEERVLEQMRNTIERKEDGIYCSIPWIGAGSTNLPSNRAQSVVRLKKLVQTLNHKGMLQKYHDDIMSQLKSDFIEMVPTGDYNSATAHYIPHRGVEKPTSTTTALRIVFDASCKSKGFPSLNNVMHRGKNLLPSLVGLLLRARCPRYLLVSDVQKAFYALRLKTNERDNFRFLWLKDIHNSATDENVIEFRFKRVLFGARSSPFILAAVLDTILRQVPSEHQQLAEEIRTNIYVDNVIMGADHASELDTKYRNSKEIFRKEMFMNLRQYASNWKGKLNIPAEDREDKEEISLLGVYWNRARDQLIIRQPPSADDLSLSPSGNV